MICASAYVEHIGIDAKPGEDALDDDDILMIAALASRVTALAELLEQGRLRTARRPTRPAWR